MNIRRIAFLKPAATRQRGAALFIALVMLVAMMLAVVALVRSVDTATIIAGNLAFKQASTSSADIALNNASDWLNTTNVATPSTLESDSATVGYYATSTGLDLMNDATWTTATSALASGSGITAGVDSGGNQINYVIQRMCSSTGTATTTNCLFGAATVTSSSQAVHDATEAGGATTLSASPIYRITVRVSGPRNTISYVQGFLY